MENFRNPKYIERYEDVFDLDTPLKMPEDTAHQNKTGYRFVANNSGEISPFDWYRAKFIVDFKVNKLVDGTAITIATNGIVNGSHSLIKNIIVKSNGIQVYANEGANQSVNIKKLLEYNKSYANSTATNQFYYLDTSSTATRAGNDGFFVTSGLLNANAIVNTEIPLNRYSFFGAFENMLMPNTKIEIDLIIESDANLIWQSVVKESRVIITNIQLWVPRATFTAEGQALYMSKYLKPQKWNYLRENIFSSNATTNKRGTFQISSGQERPRYIFVYIRHTVRDDDPEYNPFLYNTFLVGAQKLTNCHLEISNGIHYPENEYTPNPAMSRVFQDVLNYVHGHSDYSGGTLLTRTNFLTMFPLVFFDLTYQKLDIKNGTTKLTFKYQLADTANLAYVIHALVLYDQTIELINSNGKLLLRS